MNKVVTRQATHFHNTARTRIFSYVSKQCPKTSARVESSQFTTKEF